MKYQAELDYWSERKSQEGTLGNAHYEFLHRKYWGLDTPDIARKKLLDIGCGPRGSLEWATDAALRVGLDPLALAYEELGAAEHKMKYVCAFAERIPYPDCIFDIVYSINSLDHVDNLNMVVTEIQRVLKPGGWFLLLVETHPKPTRCEPVAMKWDITHHFRLLTIVQVDHFEQNPSMTVAITESPRFDHTNTTPRNGILSAKFFKPY